jgi:hypothetical protein
MPVSGVTVYLTLPNFGYHTSHTRKHISSSQGLRRGEQNLFCNSLLEIPQLPSNSWPLCMLVLKYLSPPSQRNKPPVGKPHITNPINNEHLCTAGHCNKQENSNLIWKTGMSDLFPYSYWWVHSLSFHLFDCLAWDFNYGPWPVTPWHLITCFVTVHLSLFCCCSTNMLQSSPFF